MKNELEAVFTKLTTVTPEPEDYTGEDGLLYCGKCRTPKEAYHTEETRALTGHDKRPSECDCQRAKRLEREAAEQRRKHLQTVDELKQKGFTDPKIRKWTFENDNGRNPQMDKARFYADNWEAMRDENIGYLFWGGEQNTFRADGKYGQLSILCREKDAVITVVAECREGAALNRAIFDELYPQL